RLIRALEVWELTGRPISSSQQEWDRPPADIPRCVWIDRPRAELHARINERVTRMIESGWVAEAKRLLDLPQSLSREASQALGYSELFAHLQGQASLPEAMERIRARSRQFAKRQVTWFRNMPECRPITLLGKDEVDSAVADLLR